MGDDRTTIELSEEVRDRLKDFKNEQNMTYDDAVDDILSMVGHPNKSPIDAEYRYLDPDSVFRCESSKSKPLCVFTKPYRAKEGYLFRSRKTITLNEFLEQLTPIFRHYKLYHDNRRHAGSFVVNQGGHNWIGWGIDNFLKTCSNQDERYEGLEDLKTHHHESAVYIYNSQEKLIIFGQPYAYSDKTYIKRAGFYLLTSGIPAGRDFTNLLEQMPAEMGNGFSWDPLILDWWDGRQGYGPRGTPSALEDLDPRTGVPLTDDSGDILGYACANPYFQQTDRLLNELNCEETGVYSNSREIELTRFVEPFVSSGMVLLRTSFPHQTVDETYYEPERFTISELPGFTGIGGGIAVDIEVSVEGDYY